MIEPEGIETRVDVLAYDTADAVEYREVGAGAGADVVAAHRAEYRRHRRSRRIAVAAAAVLSGAVVTLATDQLLLGALAGSVLILLVWSRRLEEAEAVPTVVQENAMPSRAAREYDIESYTDDPFSG